MSECKYFLAWRGTCGKKTDKDSDDRCTKHFESECRSCGERAVKECSETMGLVCGEPLCEDCSCTQL